MRWVLLALVGCDAPVDDVPFDTVVTDPVCSSTAVEVWSPHYRGAPIFSSGPFLEVSRLEYPFTLARVDIAPPQDLTFDTERQPGGTGHLVPHLSIPPGARLRLDEGYGCPVWEGDVHPAGLPVKPADLHGRTWVLRDAPGWEILTSLGQGDEFPVPHRFKPAFTDGAWPMYLHAEVDGESVSWTLALGDVAAGGVPNPCVLPTALAPAAPFDAASPEVIVPTLASITTGGPAWSFTLHNPSLRFTPTPGGASAALVRFTATVDPRELAEQMGSGPWQGPPPEDWCFFSVVAAPQDAPPPPCLPCTTTPSGFCTDRALIILDAPAVDVPWPTEASIAANPACLTAG